jgi:hypothetical protein
MLLAEDAFYKIIEDTWNSTLGFEVERSNSEAHSDDGEIIACSKVSGAWNGEVHLFCPRPLGRLIAAAFFQVDANKAGNDQILDALSELIHIVGGNLKGLLPQPITLSLPSSEDSGTRPKVIPNAQTVCRLSLTSSGCPFTVSLEGGLPAEGVDHLSAAQKSRPHVDHP